MEIAGPLGALALYLWLLCDARNGISAAEFGLAGGLPVSEFIALPPFTNAGTATDLRLSAGGCHGGPRPTLVGRIVLEPGTVANEALSWGRIRAAYK